MVRSFAVVGDLGDPDRFLDALLHQLLAREQAHFEAREIGNDLAARRGDAARTFVLEADEIFLDARVVNGRDIVTGAFVQVRLDDPVELVVNP